MPLNNLSIGHDVTVTIYDNNGTGVLTFPAATGFEADPIFKQIDSTPLNNYPIFAEAPAGWKGTIEYDRTNPTIDAYFAQLEANYYNNINILDGTITETIQESGGGVTQFTFKGVALKLEKGGKWKANEKVPMTIAWMCSTRLATL